MIQIGHARYQAIRLGERNTLDSTVITLFYQKLFEKKNAFHLLISSGPKQRSWGSVLHQHFTFVIAGCINSTPDGMR